MLLPLLFRAMWRLGEQPDRRRAIGVGILFTLLGYQYWFYAIFAGLIFLVWLGMTLYREGRSERGPS